jgi:hypothetical protein
MSKLTESIVEDAALLSGELRLPAAMCKLEASG